MTRHVTRGLSISVCVALLALDAFAQAPFAQAPAPTPTPTSSVVLKLQITVSRFMGTNKVSSQPYLLSLVPNESGSIKVGSEVPVPAAYTNPNTGANSAATAQPSYTLQQVGTQIDGNATLQPDGRYKLRLTVTDRSVLPTAQATEQGARVVNVPAFRNVVVASTIYLRDGQTTEFSSVADKTGGEVVKVEVSLTYEK